jgi:hypothetical protein
MTPDDMETVVERLEEDAKRLGWNSLCSVVSKADLRALLLDYQERGRALANLIRMNEEHNAAVEKVMGRPLNWSDDYLNEARATLKGKSHD